MRQARIVKAPSAIDDNTTCQMQALPLEWSLLWRCDSAWIQRCVR